MSLILVHQQSFSLIEQNEHQTIIDKFQVQVDMAKRLLALKNYEIVLVCDDLTSMNIAVRDHGRTRWDRLRDIVKLIREVEVIFDSNGGDVYFLNQEPLLNVRQANEID